MASTEVAVADKIAGHLNSLIPDILLQRKYITLDISEDKKQLTVRFAHKLFIDALQSTVLQSIFTDTYCTQGISDNTVVLDGNLSHLNDSFNTAIIKISPAHRRTPSQPFQIFLSSAFSDKLKAFLAHVINADSFLSNIKFKKDKDTFLQELRKSLASENLKLEDLLDIYDVVEPYVKPEISLAQLALRSGPFDAKQDTTEVETPTEEGYTSPRATPSPAS